MKNALSISFIAALSSTPVHAELPQPVRAMLDAAIATGDAQKVATVAEIARQTNPDDGDEIDQLLAEFAETKRAAEKLAAKEAERQIRSAGLFENWSGEGQIGASHSSGNTDNVGVNAALKVKREGVDWSHRLRFAADYQRTNGSTSRAQYLAVYEPRFQVNDGLFTYGLAQYDRDRIQGFSNRYSFSGGLGYTVFNRETLNLSVKAGPSYRRTNFVDGSHENSFGALFGLDFDWQIIDGLKLTHDANLVTEGGSSATLIIDSSNTTINLLTGLQAKVSDRLSTRFSYQIEYDSNPPVGAVSTDTTSRFSLVYGF